MTVADRFLNIRSWTEPSKSIKKDGAISNNDATKISGYQSSLPPFPLPPP